MAQPGDTDLCRITVVAPSRRVDIAVPGYVPFANLFPAIAEQAGLTGPEVVGQPGGWALQRLGQEPFAPAVTPHEAGLTDGELIYLRPYRKRLPPLAFDDVADLIATTMNDHGRKWEVGHARKLALGVAAVALVAGAVAVLRAGPPWAGPSLVAAIAAVALLAGAAGVSRAVGDALAGAMLGYAALPFAFVAGLTAFAGSAAGPGSSGPAGAVGIAGVSQFGAVHLLAAFGAVALAAVIAAAGSGEIPMFSGLAAAALLGLIASLADTEFGTVGIVGAFAMVTVVALALTTLIPAASFRMARVDLPQVPRDADDLRRDTLAVDEVATADRAVTADWFVTGAVAGLGSIAAITEFGLALRPGWMNALTCAVLASVLLSRSRMFRGAGQRLWLLLPGYGGLVLLAAGLARQGTQLSGLVVAAAPLIAGAALVLGVGIWLPGHRPSPFWGRAADIADMIAIIGLFPLVLGVAGIFGDVRSLVG